MKIWVGLVAVAGIAISAGTTSAQGIYPRGGYGVASDLDGPYADEPYSQRPYADVPPYAALPPEGPRPLPPRIVGPRYGERSYDERSYDGPGYAPAMLPPTAVYWILRERGYSPLGIPQQRGLVYTISVISPDGDDGRLVIDARSGRILRFLPAYRLGDRMNQEITVSYGPAGVPLILAPILAPNGLPRPPVANPKLASRSPSVPLPKPVPARAVATPAQSIAPKAAAMPQPKPADAQASIQQQLPAEAPVPASPPAVIEAQPALKTTPAPVQDMPPVQGLE